MTQTDAPEYLQGQVVEEPSGEGVDRLRKLVEYADKMQLWIDATEAELETAKKNQLELLSKTIPDQMDTIGTNVFGVPGTDRECRVTPFYHAVLKSDSPNLEEAVAWLDGQGHGDVVKHSIHIDFNREDAEKAKQIAERLRQMLAEYDVAADTTVVKSYGVHWKTLTSLVKELVEKGENIPLALLGATVGRVAKIIKRKVK